MEKLAQKHRDDSNVNKNLSVASGATGGTAAVTEMNDLFQSGEYELNADFNQYLDEMVVDDDNNHKTVSSILNAYENILGIKLQMEEIQRIWLNIASFACVVKQNNALMAMGCFCVAMKRMEFPVVQSALGKAQKIMFRTT
eukprot:scaffold64292_cov23-Cyclotella_meneghiniana.AAC.1